MQQRFRRQLLALTRVTTVDEPLRVRFERFVAAVRAAAVGQRPNTVEVLDVLLAIGLRREVAAELSGAYGQAIHAALAPGKV